MTLEEELEAIFAARDRSDMQPTINALLPILKANPENARVLYEVGGAYDTSGAESVARGYYERALDAGLSGDIHRRCLLQYGSTLRNLGELEPSATVFRQAREMYPHSTSLKVFEALTKHALGDIHGSVALLLEVIADAGDEEELSRYLPAIRGNAAWISGLVQSESTSQDEQETRPIS